MPLDYIAIWILTVLNSLAIILIVRQLARLPDYQGSSGPKPGTAFANWTLRTLSGEPRSATDMPSEYTILFASDTCGPCRGLFAQLAASGRTRGKLVVAADGDAGSLAHYVSGSGEALYDDFLSGADFAFRQQMHIPGTPFAIALRQGRVLAAGPTTTPAQLQNIADSLQGSRNRARAG